VEAIVDAALFLHRSVAKTLRQLTLIQIKSRPLNKRKTRLLWMNRMSERVVCDEKGCTECERVIVRTYGELREEKCSDGDALNFCADLLELRHPGHGWYYYFCCTARLLGRTRSLLD
jgi:hypothetical protein